MNFDGTDDYVEVPTSSSLSLPTAFALAAWIKPESNNTRLVLGKASSYKMYLTSGGLSLYNGSVGNWAFQNVGNVPLNEWDHVVSVYDGTTVKAYVNGEEAYSASYSTSFGTPTSILKIGQDPNGTGQSFSGQIDDVRIYNYALSPAQIQKVMNEGMAVRYRPVSGEQ